jgi:hypothetical protein
MKGRRPQKTDMPRYYFNIRNGEPFDDIDGLELSGPSAARAEAIGFAKDLMRLGPIRRDWSKWSIHVTDDSHGVVLDIPFLDAAEDE